MKCPYCGGEAIGQFCPYCRSEMPSKEPNATVTGPTTIINNYYSNTPSPQQTAFTSQSPLVSEKNKWIAFALCFFTGFLGGHYFYVGRFGKAILYFFTGGLFGIGWLFDLIIILNGKFTDYRSFPLR